MHTSPYSSIHFITSWIMISQATVHIFFDSLLSTDLKNSLLCTCLIQEQFSKFEKKLMAISLMCSPAHRVRGIHMVFCV